MKRTYGRYEKMLAKDSLNANPGALIFGIVSKFASYHEHDEDALLCSPEPKAQGELIVYQSSHRLCVCVHIFKH